MSLEQEAQKAQIAICSEPNIMLDKAGDIRKVRQERLAVCTAMYMKQCVVSDVRVVGYPSELGYRDRIQAAYNHYHFSPEDSINANSTGITA